MKDEILEEVWAAKDAVAKKYGYDPKVMAKALMERQKHSKVPTVNLHDQRLAHVAEEPTEYKIKAD
jgi:phosphopantetheinyl transferase (holo-ACP synthase)